MPRLLDLFCGAGGAAMGYHRAGFEVVGVDNRQQPRYPFEFHEADALAWDDFDGFDLIHASPPCQAYSALRTVHKREHPELVEPTRERLQAAGLPWIIENVPGSPLRASIMLCGSTFGLGSAGRVLHRHRYFETSWPLLSLVPPCDHRGRGAIGVYGHGQWSNDGSKHRGGYQGSAAECGEAMGIEWMTRDGVTQAIPPAYTEWIGGEWLAANGAAVAV